MAMAPLGQMSKQGILELFRWRCSHGHSGIAHYSCYLKEEHGGERIGFLDLECSNLKANFGIILSYCIKDHGGEILYDCITKEDLDTDLDKRITKACINDLLKFERVVTHYGERFDLPYLRTRALYWGLDFPGAGEIVHTDVWKIARRKLCLSSNRQGVISEAINRKSLKTRIDSRHWIKALMGEKKALDYILDHNMKDVIDLEKNYNKLVKFAKKSNTSI